MQNTNIWIWPPPPPPIIDLATPLLLLLLVEDVSGCIRLQPRSLAFPGSILCVSSTRQSSWHNCFSFQPDIITCCTRAVEFSCQYIGLVNYCWSKPSWCFKRLGTQWPRTTSDCGKTSFQQPDSVEARHAVLSVVSLFDFALNKLGDIIVKTFENSGIVSLNDSLFADPWFYCCSEMRLQ
jgi:hypothetical protein